MSDEVMLRLVREDDLPMLEELTAHRIWASTEVDNIAEQRALEKIGFTREGITRATGWRDGAWRDGVIYSLLRADPAV
jgi:RimJ/RimL family protein N-acetyltransferase